ncbi:MAG: hypothetical protein ABIZ70_10270 [Gemmatimonadales bacterium]
MNEQLKERLLRRLETLSDERGFQVLDYVEFLESKYAERAAPSNVFSKITDTVTDAMRAGKLSADAISGTVGLFDGASKVMKGVASAAQAVVAEASKTAQSIASPKPDAPSATPDATPPTDTSRSTT